MNEDLFIKVLYESMLVLEVSNVAMWYDHVQGLLAYTHKYMSRALHPYQNFKESITKSYTYQWGPVQYEMPEVMWPSSLRGLTYS